VDPGQPKELRFHVFAVRGVRCAIAICSDLFGVSSPQLAA